MFGLYNYISTKLLGRESLHEDSSNQSKTPYLTSFDLFPSLPPELRRKIWEFALPERLVEATLDFDVYADQTWGFCFTEPIPGIQQDPRPLPTLFYVNVESREFCLEQYVQFGNTFIHPNLDLLYILWQTPAKPREKFFPIQDLPLSKFQKVAMTLNRNFKFDGRFEVVTSCLRSLGVPKQLLLSLSGSVAADFVPAMTGFSISNGQKVILLNPSTMINMEDMAQVMRAAVVEELRQENVANPAFIVPEVDKSLHYFCSGAHAG